jgi:HAD superfamily hydrolase (TIGR01549 family)
MNSPDLTTLDAILFDLGGTVLEVRHDAVAKVLARHGAAPAPGWEAAGERAGRRAMEERLREHAPPPEVWRAFFVGMMMSTGVALELSERAFPEVRAFHREHHLWARALPGMDEALTTLRARGYRVAAVSNSDGRAQAILADLGLGERFEFVIDSHDVGVEKPDARIFLLACERLGLAPGRCAYVGDVMAFDVEGARGAGLVPIRFDPYGCYDEGPVDGAHVRGPEDLLALFPGRARRSA